MRILTHCFQQQDAVPIVKITDFGSSKNFESNKLSTFVGTPDYLAPEVVVGKVRILQN
jgi:serine/threonine protein kinase